MKIWELSDGRIWQIERRDLDQYHVSSWIDSGLSVIGNFETLAKIERFALDYLRLTIVNKEG